jgi:outer membrane protein TolC
MSYHRQPKAGGSFRSSAKLLVPVLLFVAGPLAGAGSARAADEPTTPPPAPAAQALDLAACLNLALERQPRIAAARASLAAAEDSKRALDDLRGAAIVEPEIPVRRKQACLGVTAAAAGVEQAEHETVYAVTRTYFTVIYAREQERVARSVVDRLGAINEVARGALQSGAKNVNSNDVNRTTVYLRLAQTQQYKSAMGVKRAIVALREAIGMGPECRLEVAAGHLPEVNVQLNEDEIVAAALSHRAEMIQAGIFAQETCLEIEAQSSTLRKRVDTFAAGADIHSHPVPLGEHNEDYRPGGILPEMPVLMAGCRRDRVEHARSLNARADAVVESTRNLIALEADDAYLRWDEASQEVSAARAASESGEQLADDLTKDFTSGLKVRVDEVVNARVLGSQARSRYNEYLYRQILALADIERITGGVVCSGLVELAGSRREPAAINGGK